MTYPQIGKSQNQYHYEKAHQEEPLFSGEYFSFAPAVLWCADLPATSLEYYKIPDFLFQISHTHTDNIIGLKLIIALLTGCYMFQKLFQFPPVQCMIDICLYFCQCFFTFHIDSSLCADSFPDNPELASSYHETGKN